MRIDKGLTMNSKHAILRAAWLTGFSSAVRRSGWRNARLAILCYHGVSLDDEHDALPELYVSPEHLRRRLEHLRRDGCAVLPLREGLDRLFAGRLPPRSIALTFDDGTRDFSEVAVPLLIEFGMPATVYLTTYYCENPWPVFDTAIRYMLWRGRDSGVDLSDAIGGTSHRPLLLHSAAERTATSAAISHRVRQTASTAVEKQDLLGRVARRVDVDFEAFLAKGQFSIMTPAQVARLPETLIDVQLHTHRHRTPRDEELFAREIIDNRASLNRVLGNRTSTHFCYPSGDYGESFLHWLKDLEMTSATTCVPGLASANSHPFLLPRFVDTSLISELAFDSWLSGVADLLPRRREFHLDVNRK